MINIICSPEAQLAKRACDRLVKKTLPERNEWNYISFNMAVTKLKELADECEGVPFMTDKKVVVADDCAFLAKTKTKYKYQSDDVPEALRDYVDHPNEFVDLYLLVYSDALDEKNPIVAILELRNAIKQVAVPKPEEWMAYATKFLAARRVSIDNNALTELVARSAGDYGVFVNELEKYACYADVGGSIRLRDVEALTAPKLEENAFQISNALMKNDVARAMAIYKDLKVFGAEEVMLINLLSKQLIFMEQVYFLDGKGLSVKMIADELKAKPFRIEMTLRNLYRVPSGALERIIEELYEAEMQILTGKASAKFAFERFLANFDLRK
ncbi:MAG: DNA polymerase III subunit delta [Bacilli bacterium]|nr:DNA polymerase III subunit delta [Bacilli bacterium]